MQSSELKFAASPLDLRRRLVHGIEGVAYWSGAAALYLRIHRVGGAAILMYHSVPTPQVERWIAPRNCIPVKIFEAQMRFLAHHRRVISIDELVAMLERGEPPQPGTVVITFDDGYRDILDTAAPILARFDLPAVVYLATAYITAGANQWLDRVYVAFTRRTRDDLRLRGFERPHVDLRDSIATAHAYSFLTSRLLVSEWSERCQLLDEIESQLRPKERAPRLMLNWNDVTELVRRNPRFEIGVHTRHHIDLSARVGEAAQAELDQSLADVKRELGREPRHFSFPYGRANDASRKVIVHSGLRSAVITDPAHPVKSDTDRFALPRFEAPRGMTQFRLWTSGAWPDLIMTTLGQG